MTAAPAIEFPLKPSRAQIAADLYGRAMNNPWIPVLLEPKQVLFLSCPDREALYGGAAGGGKSVTLLAGGLQHVDVPGYNALLMRRTYAELEKADGLIPRSHQWLAGTAARWNDRRKIWTFPSGATMSFGYMEHKGDEMRYQGTEYHYFAPDELTHFREEQFLYIHGSRMRKSPEFTVPLRTRAATNPGGPGHQWVYLRYPAPGAPYRFVPATLDDNPHIDAVDYTKSMELLDPITYAQLREGKWILDPRGHPYLAEWWQGRNRYDATDASWQNKCIARYLSYDTATKTESHNAYTARNVFEVLPDYRAVLRNVWKDRILGCNVADVVTKDAHDWNHDNKLRGIVIEDKDSGSTALQGIWQRGDWVSALTVAFNPAKFGDKLVERPQRAALWCSRNSVLLPEPSDAVPWLHDFEMDLFQFPDVKFMDTVDAFNQGVIFLEHYLADGWRSREGLNRVA